YFDEETKSKFLPYVIEPTLGVERVMFAVLCEAYRSYPLGRKQTTDYRLPTTETTVDSSRKSVDLVSNEAEIVLHLDPRLAPITVAVLPLVKKDGMPEKAREIVHRVRAAGLSVAYDESATIGRRYRRQDEIGTPWCVTIDGETVEKGTVTLRDRDTMEQERIPAQELMDLIRARLR
ncbi:hypothetical protein HY523_00665, partial [Candidatus Berkelbacteria bacterium]|nr:hypothetical protein [Candidatus Berkelbacteria bacterium]